MAAVVAAALLLAGCLRIAATYPVFTQTWDEPAHIAAGLEWLQRGEYNFEPLHPPLARIAAAVGPYLAGARLTPDEPIPGSRSIESSARAQPITACSRWPGQRISAFF